ncbi:hypothetical protein [Pelagibius marinus]|uniref:hypothetical protein n=1 Tax=Pelagibius marinus TaxID=2762760 RepID=UPI001872E87C|nr:hypothetical protein [Pelagibius marinus]
MDASAGRLSVFDDVVRKNFYIRFFYALYEKSPGFLKTTLLIIYGLKCYLSVNWASRAEGEIAFFASYPNERVALDHLRRNLPELSAAELTISRRNCLGWPALAALPAFLACVARLWPLAARLSRRLHFMPACRVFSTTAFYLRFGRLLKQRRAQAVFIANHYSPECLALAAAAHRQGGKVLFVNHANATGNKVYAPPLHCDLAALTGQGVLDAYMENGRPPVNAVFIPPTSPQAQMRSHFNPEGGLSVGIFLTALTDMARLEALVAQLLESPRVARVLIRPHPVKVINEDLSGLCTADGRVQETGGSLLIDDVRLCDLAICGNSTATIEVLRGGLPVFYDAALDSCGHDLNGHLHRKLVPPLPERLDEAALEAVAAFYDDPDWLGRMRYFDASYRGDEAEMFRRLAVGIRETLQDSGLAPLLLTPAAAPAAQDEAQDEATAAAEEPRRAEAGEKPEARPWTGRRLSG